ncbi:MAG TPA: hypothetical protein VMN36_06445 [Verrucomicrobiales bacterium]|nr:hypothetical protein [Verrucomicrobiales bacterium]
MNRFEITLDAGLASDSDTVDLSGNISGTLTLDPDTGQASAFTLSGGALRIAPIHVTLTLFGFTLADVVSSEVVAVPSTPLAPGLVDPATGEFDAAQYEVLLISGILTSTGQIEGEIDIAEEDVSGTGLGTGTIALTETGRDAASVTYEVEVTLPIDFEDEIDDDELSFGATVSVQGTIFAAGPVTVSLDGGGEVPSFDEWLAEQGLTGAEFDEDSTGDGIDNGVRYALGIPVGQVPGGGFPAMEEAGGMVTFAWPLPASGSLAAVAVEELLDSVAGTWGLVDAAQVIGGMNPLPAESTGSIVVQRPAGGENTVLRLRASQP